MTDSSNIFWRGWLEPDKNGQTLYLELQGHEKLPEYHVREYLVNKTAEVQTYIDGLTQASHLEAMDEQHPHAYVPMPDPSSTIDKTITRPGTLIIRGNNLHELEELKRTFDNCSKDQSKPTAQVQTVAGVGTPTVKRKPSHLRLVVSDGKEVINDAPSRSVP